MNLYKMSTGRRGPGIIHTTIGSSLTTHTNLFVANSRIHLLLNFSNSDLCIKKCLEEFQYFTDYIHAFIEI